MLSAIWHSGVCHQLKMCKTPHCYCKKYIIKSYIYLTTRLVIWYNVSIMWLEIMSRSLWRDNIQRETQHAFFVLYKNLMQNRLCEYIKFKWGNTQLRLLCHSNYKDRTTLKEIVTFIVISGQSFKVKNVGFLLELLRS